MTAITITYGRKQPGSREYSSENLTITLSQELGENGVEDSEIRSSIDAIYHLLREEVERRLTGTSQTSVRLPDNGHRGGSPSPFGSGASFGNGSQRRQVEQKASQKQVSYLLALAAQQGLSFVDLGRLLEEKSGKRDPHELTTREAARVIDLLKNGRGVS